MNYELQTGPVGDLTFDGDSCHGKREVDVLSLRTYTFYVSFM